MKRRQNSGCKANFKILKIDFFLILEVKFSGDSFLGVLIIFLKNQIMGKYTLPMYLKKNSAISKK